jgi:cell division protein FtsX
MGWFGALKLVPWSEVIEAAPGLVRGARRIFAQTQDEPAAPTTAEPPPAAAVVDPTEALRAQLQQLEAQVQALSTQQQAAAGLLESLTEHNARLVEAVQMLRLRQRWLVGAVAALTLALALVAALALRA